MSRYKIKLLFKESLKDLKKNFRHIRNHNSGSLEISFATLRMFCHMLDKGMNNPQFEKGHSLDVLQRARDLSDKLRQTYSSDKAFVWCEEVIGKFEAAQISGEYAGSGRMPKVYSEEEADKYRSFIKNRVSCRNFYDKKIPQDILEKIVELAADAPNGCCRQVVRYHVSQDENTISKAVPNIAGITNFSRIPCLVCVSAETSYYELIDRNLQYIDAALSVENFLLGATIYGVYGTVCNFFHADKKQEYLCRKLFNIPKTENIVVFIAVGYPQSLPEKPSRRDNGVFLIQ